MLHIPSRLRSSHGLGLVAVLALAAALGVVGLPGGAQAQAPQELPRELEQRAQHFYGQLMCPTCPGQNIGQSNAPISADMRAIVREKLLAGESDQAILAYFVNAYGESVLASPPREGVALAVWLVPPFALALGGVAVFLTIIGLRKAQAAESRVQPPRTSAEQSLEPYLAMVDSELGALEADESRRTAPPSPPTLSDRT